MWNKIKSWFGWADLNNDGKVDAADLEVAKVRVEEKIAAAEAVVVEIKDRAKNVKEEIRDVKVAVKDVVNQTTHVVAAAKGKKRPGRKPKTKK